MFLRAQSYRVGLGTTAASFTSISNFLKAWLKWEYDSPPEHIQEVIILCEADAIQQMLNHVTLYFKSREQTASYTKRYNYDREIL